MARPMLLERFWVVCRMVLEGLQWGFPTFLEEFGWSALCL